MFGLETVKVYDVSRGTARVSVAPARTTTPSTLIVSSAEAAFGTIAIRPNEAEMVSP